MKNIVKEISRRNVFRYLGNAAVALPFMRTLLETNAYGEVNRKRAVFFYYPNGVITEEFFPTTLGTDFKLQAMSMPLNRVRDDIILMKNVSFKGSSHEENMNYGMTGVNGFKPALSIDTVLGDLLKEGTSTPVLRLGAASQIGGKDNWRTASFFAPGQTSQIEDNPTKAFESLFGSVGTAQPTSGISTTMRKSVLDACLEDLKGLQASLGTIEKVKLELHVESVREIERRIQSVSSGTGTLTQCTKTLKNTKVFNSTSSAKEWLKPENFGDVVALNIEIAIQALACGMTNVVYLQNTHSVGTPPFANGVPDAKGKDHHQSSHYNEFNSRPDHIANQNYFMARFADLVAGMKDIKEGDKTLLYNSTVMAWTELGESSAHSSDKMATILAGQAGGFFKTGRYIDIKGESQNRLLVSMMRSMGSTVETFGDANFGRGIIEALKG